MDLIDDAGRMDERQVILSACRCRTRHMHQQATSLERQWPFDPQYIIDWERYCARPRKYGEAAQNWFAVEVYQADLRRALCPPEPQERQETTAMKRPGSAILRGPLLVVVGAATAVVPGVPPLALGIPLVSWIALVLGLVFILRDRVG